MMNHAQYFCYISILCIYTSLAFQKTSSGIRYRASRISVAAPDHDVDDEVRYTSIVVSGFLSKENDFAETSVFSKLFKAKKWAQVTSVTDNIKFARKRLMSPQLVYSGLSDVLSFAEVDKSDESMETAIQGKDVWLSYNLTSAELLVYAKIAAKVGIKRVIFAVNVPTEESGDGVTFTSAVETLAAANIQYTIVKFGETRKIGEAKYPYRIVGGEMALPKEGNDILSSDDLTRVLVEIVELPKTFNTVYGIGPGNRLDSEMSVYMKSQGWPEQAQISLLLGDFMSQLRVRYAEEVIIKAEKDAIIALPVKKDANALPVEGEGNKFAGFF